MQLGTMLTATIEVSDEVLEDYRIRLDPERYRRLRSSAQWQKRDRRYKIGWRNVAAPSVVLIMRLEDIEAVTV